MDTLNELIVSWAGSPFVLLAVVVLVTIDGFFPPIPGETVVVALASIGIATGAPNVWAVLAAAAVGSFLGDNIAFLIGRRIDLGRYRWTRGARATRALERVRGALDRRAASVILTARFVPVGRVTVNVLAGSAGFPRRRFVALSAVSAVAWAGYSVLVGAVAGAWLRDQPLIGAAVAVVIALGVGWLTDLVIRRVGARKLAGETRRAAAEPSAILATRTQG
ncbi:DedA family protein [Glaciihabitans sp. dw_435]|uniref:DedA family protein n=1 Tax=Glaciihabitans sp. dw_435 TaxID=2720081 RepID=UPI001BD1F50B|nr:DedA family protein [Glaciihabitans sp. dw_435]